MLSELEFKSGRVKRFSFDPRWPWILVALHTGVIEIWNYEEHKVVRQFGEPRGPVRGVCFHNEGPYFVSGADDAVIRVSFNTQLSLDDEVSRKSKVEGNCGDPPSRLIAELP